ncbi:MAG TPA: 2-isopropylmalate synthase, partial [Micavibrio sp.]
MDRIVIFDTTLRDGEQSPGCSMNHEEKLRLAAVLDDLGVDVIEAGFPVASPGDFHSVQEISRTVKNAVIAGLCRTKKGDIQAAADALAPAEKRRIHTFISTSPLHMKHKLQMEPDAVIDMIAESVAFARRFTDDVEWSAEDGSRSEDDFLCRAVETAIKAGATTINIPDTVGYALPDEYARRFRMLRERVPGMDKAVLSVHCHNDLGLAVANSLAGLMAGARQVECTINGIGERAGNASLEEIVMALKVRSETLGATTGVHTELLAPTSTMLSNITGVWPQPNKAVVGRNAFAHEAGIHQHGILANPLCYEIMTPASVGVRETLMVLGKHSGKHAVRSRLLALGLALSPEELDAITGEVKLLADKKKFVYDDDLLTLANRTPERQTRLVRYQALSGN